MGSEKQGLIIYDSNNDTWKSTQTNAGELYSIELIGDKLYIGGEKGLGYYDMSDQQYHAIELPAYKTSELVNSLLWDEVRQSLWVGTIGTLYRFSLTDNSFQKIDVRSTGFKCMTFDVNQSFMIGTDNGLIAYNPEKNQAVYSEHEVR